MYPPGPVGPGYHHPVAAAPYHYPGCTCASCAINPTMKLMETKLDGLRSKNRIMAEKVEEIKENRILKAKNTEIKKLEVSHCSYYKLLIHNHIATQRADKAEA